MFILKHLKTPQHVSIIIQIIFSELVCSLLKSLILKFVKNVKSQCCDAAGIMWGIKGPYSTPRHVQKFM